MSKFDPPAREAYAPTLRFSDRVADYERWRPGYPAELTPWLVDHCGLKAGDAVADVGSGTGLFARELLAAGLQVHGVEPNAPMRAAAERSLAGDPRFRSVDGRAEATGLAAASMRLVTVAQAFHWFDVARTRAEFARVLAPPRWVALIWNVRRIDAPFLRGYEDMLLRFAPEYGEKRVPEQASESEIRAFFAPRAWLPRDFAYVQRLNCEGLRGRLLSSSYVPAAGRPGHAGIVAACDALFAAHAHEGLVDFAYDTRVFLGQL